MAGFGGNAVFLPSFPGDLEDYADKDEPQIGGRTGKVSSLEA